MKILNFHYNHSHQHSFHCCNIIFVFVMGNGFLHIYVEAVIYVYVVYSTNAILTTLAE